MTKVVRAHDGFSATHPVYTAVHNKPCVESTSKNITDGGLATVIDC